MKSVWSLNQKWSAGFSAGASSDTYQNIDFRYHILPAIEYSFFPYNEFVRREMVINYRIGYGFDITSISGWSIVTNFERFGASGKGYVNELYLLLGYVPIDDTEYAMKLDNDKASLTYKKNLNSFDIKMSSNYNFMGEIPDYGANLEISNKF